MGQLNEGVMHSLGAEKLPLGYQIPDAAFSENEGPQKFTDT